MDSVVEEGALECVFVGEGEFAWAVFATEMELALVGGPAGVDVGEVFEGEGVGEGGDGRVGEVAEAMVCVVVPVTLVDNQVVGR